MPEYTAISIIYNPNSTGPGRSMAHDLQRQLQVDLPGQTIELIKTQRQGHAEELAFSLAKSSQRPLIISASGDGGYHEVVNGAIRAQLEGARPTTGLLPAGNANDHYRNLHGDELVDAIVNGNAQTIDLLKLAYRDGGKPKVRFAHSYVGLGFTPQAGRELNQHQLNRFNEIWLVAKILLFLLKPVRLQIGGKVIAYDSLIFSNVPKMSKILTLSDIADATDGKFEITAFRRRNRLGMILTLLTASTRGLRGRHQASAYRFETTKPALVQLDGEIHTIDAGASVSITIEPRVLRCVI